MQNTHVLHNIIVKKLSEASVDELVLINEYLDKMKSKLQNEKSKEKVLSFAGAWNTLYEEEFNDMLTFVHEQRKEMFNTKNEE